MGNQAFTIFKVPDKSLIQAILKIAEDCNEGGGECTAYFDSDNQKWIKINYAEFESNPNTTKILSSETAIFKAVAFTVLGVSFTVRRDDFSDHVNVHFQNETDATKLATALASAHKHLKAYSRTEATDKLLGDELAEFYRKREAALLELEKTNQTLISETAEYRRQVDQETSKLRDQLRSELETERQKLKAEAEKAAEALNQQKDALEKRSKELDDRSSRHARRGIRQSLGQKIAQRNKEFRLTADTTKKRDPIHCLCIGLVILFGSLSYFFLKQSAQISPESGSTFWFLSIKGTLAVIATAASIVFYIRWNDQWFRQHAQEEFKLKRFDLDVDRAEWVIEAAQEWKEVLKSEIPLGLLDRLTTDLFTSSPAEDGVKHPTEDLASALLGATSSLSFKIPGFGEASLDRKGLETFKKTAKEAQEKNT